MKVAILKERRADETRVAAVPETVKKLVALGLDVVVEKGAGKSASVPDAAYRDAGAIIASDPKSTLKGADIVLKIRSPMIAGEAVDELANFSAGQILICQMYALRDPDRAAVLAATGVTGFALDMAPRITRAQSMDILSSQSNLAGYKSVLDAAAEFGRAFPMMMTAAGTIAPARVLVMGIGVAGLQAIATAKRLGAIVSATDVRPDTKEQVESLGGAFIAVEDEEFAAAQTSGGYAKEMSPEYQEKQAALIAQTIAKQDIVICTALIPGRPAPELISEAMVKTMKPGSVIVDLAVEAGGNCPLSRMGKVVVKHGVKIVGHANVPGRIADDASRLFSRNLLSFLTPMINTETKALNIDYEDEIIAGTLITRDGEVVHEAIRQAAAKPPAKSKSGKAPAETQELVDGNG